MQLVIQNMRLKSIRYKVSAIIFSIQGIKKTFYKKSFHHNTCIDPIPQCSGHHVSFTRRGSLVQSQQKHKWFYAYFHGFLLHCILKVTQLVGRTVFAFLIQFQFKLTQRCWYGLDAMFISLIAVLFCTRKFTGSI